MTQYNLLFNPAIKELESTHQWVEAAKLQYAIWKKEPMNLNALLCAGTQSWYGILALDRDKMRHFFESHWTTSDDDVIYSMLQEVSRWGERYFSENAIYNAYFGYMIKVMPYVFLDFAGDYDGWRVKGIKMMCHAFELEPLNPFTKAMRYEPEGGGIDTPFYNACQELWLSITPEQWGDSEVQQYFFHILHGDWFCANTYCS